MGALLEVLVQPELAGALDRVSDQGWEPAPDQPAQASFLQGYAEALGYARKLLRIRLHVAFHDIQRCDRRVGQPAAKGTCRTLEKTTSGGWQEAWTLSSFSLGSATAHILQRSKGVRYIPPIAQTP